MRQGFSRVFLKYIAVCAMLVDHIGMLFIPVTTWTGVICRVIGRLTFPIMCFFLAEGYAHTASKKKYAGRLAIFAFLSQFAYTFMHHGTLKTPELFRDYNVLFAFLLSFAVLTCYEKVENRFVKWTAVMLLTAISSVCDWGIFAPILTLCFYVYREEKRKQVRAFSIIAAVVAGISVLFCAINGYHWYGELWQLGLFLFLPFFCFYYGRCGSRKPFHKWFFYVFYPLHLFLLGILAIKAA